jgi:tetratricopeptide (TPR) repeat protein
MSRHDDQQKLQAAVSLHQAGQLDQAAELYRQIISRDAKNFYAMHYLGMIESSLGNCERAKALLHCSLAIEPPSVQFVENYATILFQMGDYKSALENAKRGLDLTPSNAGLLYVAALSLFKLERLEESIIQFDKLLAIAPNHVAAINDRGAVFAEMKHYDAARHTSTQVIYLVPSKDTMMP